MLAQRIVTALILVSVFLLANFLLPESFFLILVTLLTLAGAWEWAGLGGLTKPGYKWAYVAALLILIIAMYFVKDSWGIGMIVFGALWWGFRLVLLITNKISNNNEKILLSGLWVLMIAWLSLALIHQHSPALLLSGLVLVWGADTFAYFSGKRFGKTKLAPSISPGKTIEGVIGGSAGVFLIAVILAYVLELEPGKWAWWLLGAVLISCISVVGDLYESWLKRNAGVKDSGTLLPGHGGVLDRIDGVVAVLPFYFILINWLFDNA